MNVVLFIDSVAEIALPCNRIVHRYPYNRNQPQDTDVGELPIDIAALHLFTFPNGIPRYWLDFNCILAHVYVKANFSAKYR